VKQPIWISAEVVHAIHDEQLSEHGGPDGIRDAGLIDSALARPQNLYAYKQAEVSELAAAYLFGIVKNHGFVDGNKRVAAVVCEVFLELNGCRLTASDEAWLETVLGVAEGSMEETILAEWLSASVEKIQSASGDAG
jgi:death-on-curing protein